MQNSETGSVKFESTKCLSFGNLIIRSTGVNKSNQSTGVNKSISKHNSEAQLTRWKVFIEQKIREKLGKMTKNWKNDFKMVEKERVTWKLLERNSDVNKRLI